MRKVVATNVKGTAYFRNADSMKLRSVRFLGSFPGLPQWFVREYLPSLTRAVGSTVP